VIALSGQYDQILNYVTSVDYVFFTLSAIALFVFRARDAGSNVDIPRGLRVPGHPISTAIFMLIAFGVVLDTYIKYPQNSLIGLAILLAGIPVYYVFVAKQRPAEGLP
jgi:APA family basic amino acid/polyamine antiporter